MAKPAAKQGDRVIGIDTHVVMVPSPAGPVPTPMPMRFDGRALQRAEHHRLHLQPAGGHRGQRGPLAPRPTSHGGPFQKPPSNEATVQTGSARVRINDKPAARTGDPALTCNDPADAPNGSVIGSGRVFVGG